MTVACRIDAINVAQNGTISVQHTEGYPVPSDPSGSGTEYANLAALQQAAQTAEETLQAILPILTISRFLKTDPQLHTPSAIVGHGTIYDLTGIAAVSQNF